MTARDLLRGDAPANDGLTASAIEPPEPPWRTAMNRIVDAKLRDPALSPKIMAEGLGMSRSALYRLFEGDEGGVAAFIRHYRLRAACRLLMNPDERRLISELASACGFKSDTHFTRAFREEFGVTPSALRAMRRGTNTPRGDAGVTLDDLQHRMAQKGQAG